MPIQVVCPKCGLKLNAPDTAAGKRIRCKCGEAVGVPQGAAASVKSSAAVPAAAAQGKATSVAPNASLFDVLTDRDLKQSQANPYAPPPKTETSDAAALKNYLRKDDTAKTKAQTSQTNIIILIVGFFLGVIKNGLLVAVFYLIASLVEQVAEFDPLIRAGALFVGIVAVYAVYNLATAIGLILRAKWGWWLCTIGLLWGVFERVASAVTVLIISEDKMDAIGGILSGLIFSIMCIGFVNFMMQPETQKKFGLSVKSWLGWLVATVVALILFGATFGVGYFAGLQLDSAAANLPVEAVEKVEAVEVGEAGE